MRSAMVPVCLLMLSSAALANGRPNQMPSVVRHSAVPHVIWISASAAASEGRLQKSLMDRGSAEKLEDLVARPAKPGCHQVEPEILDTFGYGPDRPDSLSMAAKSFPVMAAGRVTGTAPGFYIGQPGKLVRAEAIEPSQGIDAGTPFFFFVPVAEFSFLAKQICVHDLRYPIAPRQGDEVVAFGYFPGGYTVQYLQVPFPENLIVARGERLFSTLPEKQLPTTRTDLFRQIESLPAYEGEEIRP